MNNNNEGDNSSSSSSSGEQPFWRQGKLMLFGSSGVGGKTNDLTQDRSTLIDFLPSFMHRQLAAYHFSNLVAGFSMRWIWRFEVRG